MVICKSPPVHSEILQTLALLASGLQMHPHFLIYTIFKPMIAPMAFLSSPYIIESHPLGIYTMLQVITDLVFPYATPYSLSLLILVGYFPFVGNHFMLASYNTQSSYVLIYYLRPSPVVRAPYDTPHSTLYSGFRSYVPAIVI